MLPRNYITLLFIITCILFELKIQRIEAAHAAKRPTRTSASSSTSSGAVKYDRSITTFSNDGRLLQVEYGMEAANRGLSVGCLLFDSDDIIIADDEGKSDDIKKEKISALCVAISVEEKTDSDDDDDDGGSKEINQESKSQKKEQYDNSIEESIMSSSFVQTEKLHRIDNHCFLLTTGLVGDGRQMAQSLRYACQNMKLQNGEIPSLEEIAHSALGDTNHELTRTSGARPFGCSSILFGVDPYPAFSSSDNKHIVSSASDTVFWDPGHEIKIVTNKEEESDSEGDDDNNIMENFSSLGNLRLFKSEPGGTVDEFVVCASGKCRDDITRALVSLREDLLENYKKESLKENDNDNDDEDTLLHPKTSIGTIAKKVAETMFNVDKKCKYLDLWILIPDDTKRGGMYVRCAKRVSIHDIDTVQSVFAK